VAIVDHQVVRLAVGEWDSYLRSDPREVRDGDAEPCVTLEAGVVMRSEADGFA
jgi:hypothetical protein